MKPWKKTLLTIIITAVVSGAIASVCTYVATNVLFLVGNHSLFFKMHEVKGTLENMYLYDIDEDKLIDDAAKGAVESLDEPYTEYYTKKEFTELQNTLNGDFVGIGATVICNENNQIEITEPLKGGAAMDAGFQAGDIISLIDGKAYAGSDLNSAVSHMRGEEGTTVKVTIIRDGTAKEYTLTRRAIHTESVSYEVMAGDVGYIKITSFNTGDNNQPSTYDEFKTAYDDLSSNTAVKKLIIDLRDNGGGDAQVVSKIADELVGNGTVFTMVYKDGTKDVTSSKEGECDLPIVVLVNGNSASASELLSGCLRDDGKAKLVGTKTYGKGVVQSLIPFTDGSGLKLTVAKYYTPNGTCVQDNGLEPDYKVELPEKYQNYSVTLVPREEDTQLAKAIEVLNNWK